MITVPLTTPVGQLCLRRTVEESFQFLAVVHAAQSTIGKVLMKPDRSLSVPVHGIGERSPRVFTITLPLADFDGLDDAEFLSFLTNEFVRQMPAHVRKYCNAAEILDPIAVSLGLPTKDQLWTTAAAEGTSRG